MSDRCAAGTLIEWGTPCSLCGNRSADGCGRDGEAWAAEDTALAEALATIARLTGVGEEVVEEWARAMYASNRWQRWLGNDDDAATVEGSQDPANWRAIPWEELPDHERGTLMGYARAIIDHLTG